MADNNKDVDTNKDEVNEEGWSFKRQLADQTRTSQEREARLHEQISGLTEKIAELAARPSVPAVEEQKTPSILDEIDSTNLEELDFEDTSKANYNLIRRVAEELANSKPSNNSALEERIKELENAATGAKQGDARKQMLAGLDEQYGAQHRTAVSARLKEELGENWMSLDPKVTKGWATAFYLEEASQSGGAKQEEEVFAPESLGNGISKGYGGTTQTKRSTDQLDLSKGNPSLDDILGQ